MFGERRVRMIYDDLYPVTTRLEPVSASEVDRLAVDYGVELPRGYRDFLARFGPGVVCGYLSVRHPDEARAWRREYAEHILCADLFDGNGWVAHGVTFDQFRRGVSVLDTDQSAYYLSVPGHGPTVFEVERGGVTAHPGGLPDVIRAVVATFGVEFPYFESARAGRRFTSYRIRPEVGFDDFLAVVTARWGAGVRRLGSKEDDYAVTLFARPVQAMFICYRESGASQPRPFSFQVNTVYDEEEAGEVGEFMQSFARV
jgi:hypothetical protein